jgi:hypothetical protein
MYFDQAWCAGWGRGDEARVEDFGKRRVTWEVAKSTIMRKCKWRFVNGRECRRLISTATNFELAPWWNRYITVPQGLYLKLTNYLFLLVATRGIVHFEHIFYMSVVSVFSESSFFLRPCANFRRVNISSMSVCPHATTRLSDEFS